MLVWIISLALVSLTGMVQVIWGSVIASLVDAKTCNIRTNYVYA